jgi:hypothetical protein
LHRIVAYFRLVVQAVAPHLLRAQAWDGYGIASSQKGDVLSQHNIFIAGEDKEATSIHEGSDPLPGFLRSEEDTVRNGAVIVQRPPDQDGFVWNNYTFATFSISQADAALEAAIRGGAGVQDTGAPSTPGESLPGGT